MCIIQCILAWEFSQVGWNYAQNGSSFCNKKSSTNLQAHSRPNELNPWIHFSN